MHLWSDNTRPIQFLKYLPDSHVNTVHKQSEDGTDTDNMNTQRRETAKSKTKSAAGGTSTETTAQFDSNTKTSSDPTWPWSEILGITLWPIVIKEDVLIVQTINQ